MSFLQSAINQVGRDAGKVVSNNIYKGYHSTPYHRTQTLNKKYPVFMDSLNFKTNLKPATLLMKLTASYAELKAETDRYLADGVITDEEMYNAVNMVNIFNEKQKVVADILEFNEDENQKEIQKLEKIATKVLEVLQKLEALNKPMTGKVNRNEIAKPNKSKSKISTGLLALFLGGLGVHKFYQGKILWGFIYLATCWTYIPVLISLVESIRFFVMNDEKFQSQIQSAKSTSF